MPLAARSIAVLLIIAGLCLPPPSCHLVRESTARLGSTQAPKIHPVSRDQHTVFFSTTRRTDTAHNFRMPPKENPCLRCKKNVGKVKAVSCATCKQWVHKECEEMTDELFNVLAGKYGGIKWECQSCQASTARLEAQIKQVETRLNKVEEKMVTFEDKSKLQETRLDKVEMIADQAKKAVEEVKEDVAKVILEEMREREDKKLNIILHSVGEAENVSAEESKKWDEASFNNIMEAMEVNMTFKECASFSRRLGSGASNKVRPLLIGLGKEEDKTKILSNARRLSQTPFRNVNIVPDLTKKQREADDDLRKEAERRNRLELTDSERSKNVKWVAVGRKGNRHLVKREVREYRQHSHPTSSNNQQQLDQTTRKRKPQEQESMASKKQKNRETEEVVGEDVVEEVEEVEVEA